MAAFGTMLHGVNIDLGFIYVSWANSFADVIRMLTIPLRI